MQTTELGRLKRVSAFEFLSLLPVNEWFCSDDNVSNTSSVVFNARASKLDLIKRRPKFNGKRVDGVVNEYKLSQTNKDRMLAKIQTTSHKRKPGPKGFIAYVMTIEDSLFNLAMGA